MHLYVFVRVLFYEDMRPLVITQSFKLYLSQLH